MKYPSLYKSLFVLSVFAFSSALGSCTRDEFEQPDPSDSTDITMTVHIPEVQVPQLRSIDGSGGEAVVDTLDVLVFKSGAAGQPDVLAQHVKVTSISIDQSAGTSTNNYKVHFKAAITPEPDATTVVVLANIPQTTIANIATMTGSDKQDVLEALKYASVNSTSSSDGWKWKANNASSPIAVPGTNYTLIPMYGEYDVTKGGTHTAGITQGMKMKNIELIRSIARIDVVNKATSDLDLTDVWVVNYNTAGYIAPAWNTANGKIYKESEPAYPYNKTNNPVLPASPGNQLGQANAMHYDYTAYGSSGIVGEIYTYEALKTTGVEGNASHTNAVCLIVKGVYTDKDNNSKSYYYRIDFTAANKSVEKVQYMPVYRNHLYSFEITNVDGPGFDTFYDALKSLGMKNNLRTTILVVNVSGVKDFVFNGEHYLGIEQETTLLNAAANSTANILCITNYAYGWQFDTSKGTNGIEYLNGSGWLTVTKDTSVGDAKKANISIVSNTVNGSSQRKAYIHIKAGTLRHKLTVIQDKQ